MERKFEEYFRKKLEQTSMKTGVDVSYITREMHAGSPNLEHLADLPQIEPSEEGREDWVYSRVVQASKTIGDEYGSIGFEEQWFKATTPSGSPALEIKIHFVIEAETPGSTYSLGYVLYSDGAYMDHFDVTGTVFNERLGFDEEPMKAITSLTGPFEPYKEIDRAIEAYFRFLS